MGSPIILQRQPNPYGQGIAGAGTILANTILQKQEMQRQLEQQRQQLMQQMAIKGMAQRATATALDAALRRFGLPGLYSDEGGITGGEPIIPSPETPPVNRDKIGMNEEAMMLPGMPDYLPPGVIRDRRPAPLTSHLTLAARFSR